MNMIQRATPELKRASGHWNFLEQTCRELMQACHQCADVCLNFITERSPGLVRCLQANLDCAYTCEATARILKDAETGSIDRSSVDKQLQACIAVCRACARENQPFSFQHAIFDQCLFTALSCEQLCRDAVSSLRSRAGRG